MALAPHQAGIGIRRHFTTEGVHPYDEPTWERRDARITNFKDGSVAFEQLGVEFPTTWSLNATNIVAQKYFRGTPGTVERESSLRQVIDRVADTITQWGLEGGYFVDEREADTYNAELKHLLVTQKAAFNSPVWFNIGVPGVPQQASACFILSVDVPVEDGVHLVVDGEDEARRSLLGHAGHADVEPHRAVEGRLLRDEEVLQLGVVGVRLALVDEVAALEAPLGDRVGHAVDHLAQRRLALGGAGGAAEVLLGDDVRGVERPRGGEGHIELFERHRAITEVRDAGIALLPRELVVGVHAVGGEVPADTNAGLLGCQCHG